MDKQHKQILRRNRVRLINDLHAESVYGYLIGANIYEPWQIDEFESKLTKHQRNSELLNSIETCGPTAFAAFLAALRSSNQGHLAELLDSKEDPPSPPCRGTQVSDESTPMDAQEGASCMFISEEGAVWPNPDGPTDFTHVKIEPTVMSTDVDVDTVYLMQSRPRGLAYIINNKQFRTLNTRHGTEVDKRNLKHVFQQLGFNVDTYGNLPAGQMKNCLEELAELNHTSFDCLIVTILSHGKKGVIYGSDKDIIKVDDIINMFSGKNCPTMAGKPKLFFLQFCRGGQLDSGVEATDGTDAHIGGPGDASVNQPDRQQEVSLNLPAVGDNIVDTDLVAKKLLDIEYDATDSGEQQTKLPNQGDMLLAYATVPGYVSWRSENQGSWFVQALCETFLKFSNKEDLLSMITRVNNKVAKAFESSTGRCKQMPAPVNMLRKKLFFFPGFYKERQIAQPTS